MNEFRPFAQDNMPFYREGHERSSSPKSISSMLEDVVFAWNEAM
jgi:hypothetical protein